jgi:hypothetical protein
MFFLSTGTTSGFIITPKLGACETGSSPTSTCVGATTATMMLAGLRMELAVSEARRH